MEKITDQDRRRVELLDMVSKKGLGVLNAEQLKELGELIKNKDYSHSKKAEKSKLKLLAKINAAIYDLEEKNRS